MEPQRPPAHRARAGRRAVRQSPGGVRPEGSGEPRRGAPVGRRALPRGCPGESGTAAGDRRVRRLLDLAWGQPVPQLPGHRALPRLPVRRGGGVRGRRLPDPPRPRAPRHRRQVERRLRGHGGADAPARRVRRPGQPRRRRPVRVLLPARHGQGHPGPARPVRRLLRAVLRRLRHPAGHVQGIRRHPARHLGHGRLLLGRARRHGDAALRHGHRPAAGPGVGALAGPGPGPHGRRPRRPAPLPPRHLPGRGPPRPVLARPGRGRVLGRAGRPRIEHVFELFDATHSGIEYRYPTGLAFLAERLGS